MGLRCHTPPSATLVSSVKLAVSVLIVRLLKLMRSGLAALSSRWPPPNC
jgi:hypothetical protein